MIAPISVVLLIKTVRGILTSSSGGARLVDSSTKKIFCKKRSRRNYKHKGATNLHLQYPMAQRQPLDHLIFQQRSTFS